MTAYCFCGPTITSEQVAAIAPGFSCLPPVAHGDLLRLPLQDGDVVLIIDGFYFQAYPVRHKEILDAMARGATVIGASSMGALRAAELGPYGMIGSGLIYQMYVSGTLTADDEVAVVHGESGAGYPALTEALVNIRATLRRARRKGVLDARSEAIILEAASKLAFHERNYPHILAIAEKHGLDQKTRALFEERLGSLRVDLKRRDAVAAVRNLSELAATESNGRVTVPQTAFLVEWRQRFTPHPGPADARILNFIRVFASDFPDLYYEVFARWCLANSPERRAMPVESPALLREAFAGARETGDLAAWCAARGLDLASLDEYLEMEERARYSSAETASAIGHAYDEAIVDYGIRTGLIDDPSVIPAHFIHWLTEADRHVTDSTYKWARILARSVRLDRARAVHRYLMSAIRVSEAFPAWSRQLDDVTELNRALAQRRSEHRPQHVGKETVLNWLRQLWSAELPFETALAIRGFSSEQAAVRAAREFLFYAKTQNKGLSPLATLEASRAV